MLTMSGRDLMKSQQPPLPLPVIDSTVPPKVLNMIRLLIRHQDELGADHARTIVLQLSGDGRIGLKITYDLPV
jgi:hypothetical protein